MRRVQRYVLLLLPMGLWLLIWAYWQIAGLSFETSRIFYGLIIFRQNTGGYMLLASAISFLLLLLVVNTIPRPISLGQDVTLAIVVILAAVAVPCSCVAAASFMFMECGTTFTHLDRINIEQQVYQVAFINNWCFGKSSYNLYRCDAVGIVCDRLQRVDTSHGTVYEASGNYQAANTAKLIVELKPLKLSIRVGEAIISTFHP